MRLAQLEFVGDYRHHEAAAATRYLDRLLRMGGPSRSREGTASHGPVKPGGYFPTKNKLLAGLCRLGNLGVVILFAAVMNHAPLRRVLTHECLWGTLERKYYNATATET